MLFGHGGGGGGGGGGIREGGITEAATDEGVINEGASLQNFPLLPAQVNVGSNQPQKCE